MTDRAAQIAAFLTRAGWQDARQTPIAGDMSPRRYSRLANGVQTAVLMDADSPMHTFVTMTEWLRTAGFSAPAILAAQPGDGLLLLEDLGTTPVKSLLLTQPDCATGIFDGCIDLLLAIRALHTPDLGKPDAETLVAWTELADQHYPGIQPDRLTAFRTILRDTLETALQSPASVSLRDFHTENLMWLPDRSAHLRLGLLDYQDAFLTHPAYDLMSLLTDARLPIRRQLREDTIARYLARSGDDPQSFRTAFDALSAQRNLRILGIFARAGKHLDHLPTTYGYFRAALENPVFDTVRADALAAIPAPARSGA
jgi:hypothetical protein